MTPEQIAAEYRSLLEEVVETARVGCGDKPVTRSNRVHIPARLYHRINAAILKGQNNEQ